MSKFNDNYEKFKEAGGSPYDGIMKAIAEEKGINYDLWHRQIFLESSFNPKAQSPTGPRGLGQFTKATGKAYGLVTDEDFFDPDKSLQASATHFQELVNTYKGDELKAMLAYNQGQGKSGSVSLAAYDRGDFAGIAPEAQNYLKLLSPASRGGREDFAEFTGVPKLPEDSSHVKFDAPDPQSESAFNYGSGLTMSAGGYERNVTSVTEVDYSTISMGQQKGMDMGDRRPTIRENYQTMQGRDSVDGSRGVFEGTYDATNQAVNTSPLGMGIRMFRANLDDGEGLKAASTLFNVLPDQDANWTLEDMDRWEAAGVDPNSMHLIYRGSRSQEEKNLKLVMENMKLREDGAKAGWGAQVAGGLVGAIGDPISYTPLIAAKGFALTARLVVGGTTGAIANVASEYLEERTSGGTPDYVMAAGVGMVFGGTISGLFGRTPPKSTALIPQKPSEVYGTEGFAAHAQDTTMSQQIRLENTTADMNAGVDPYAATRAEADELLAANYSYYKGVKYAPYGDDGSVILANGQIMDASHIDNPLSNLKGAMYDVEAPKASQAIPLGDFGTMGNALGRSEVDEIRNFGAQLVRAPQGYKDGSRGIAQPTVSDISGRIQGNDNLAMNNLFTLRDQAANRSSWLNHNVGGKAYDNLDRRVNEARELGDPSGLSKHERAYYDELENIFNEKQQQMANPSQFGRVDAPPVLQDTNWLKGYFPVIRDMKIMQQMIKKYGAKETQDLHVKSFMGNYRTDAKVRQMTDAKLTKDNGVAPTDADVMKYAEAVAHGIVVGKKNRGTNLAVDTEVSGIAQLHKNDFTEARHTFGNNYKVQASDGTMWSPNDTRIWNTGRILPQYMKRTSGDISIHAGTGKTTEDVGKYINDLAGQYGDNPVALKELKVAEGALKVVTGRSRAQRPEGAVAAGVRGLSNMSFAAKHAYFAAQNFSEVAGLMAKGHLGLLFKNVPILKDIVQQGRTAKLSDMQDAVRHFGAMEVNQRIRTSHEDTIQAIRNSGNENEWAAKIAGTFKYATQEFGAQFPLARALPATQNLIIETARMGILSDIIDNTLSGKAFAKLANFDSANTLRAASVTAEQFEGVRGLIRDHFVKQPDGSHKFVNKEAFAQDPRTIDLDRITSWAAEDAITRPDTLSNTTAGHINPWLGAAMQFKGFSMLAANSRTMKSFHDATQHGRAMDVAVKTALSSGLALMMYTIQKQATALGIPEDRRQKFLDDSFSPEMLAWAAVSRSSQLAAIGLGNTVLGAANFDFAKNVRTSLEAEGSKSNRQRETGAVSGDPLYNDSVQDFGINLLRQVPAVSTALSIGQIGYNGFMKTQDDRAQYGYNSGIHRGLSNILPNDPATQYGLLSIMREFGIEDKF